MDAGRRSGAGSRKATRSDGAIYRSRVSALSTRRHEVYLKGSRCNGPNCPIVKKTPAKNYPPGAHGQRRTRRPSEYALQLREKQRVRRYYGILETQFRKVYKDAERRGGVTGDNLMQLLETRLDNVVYRMGFAESRQHARQLVRHGHFIVNGRKTNVPSFTVRPGDEIGVRPGSRKRKYFWTVVSPASSRARVASVSNAERVARW